MKRSRPYIVAIVALIVMLAATGLAPTTPGMGVVSDQVMAMADSAADCSADAGDCTTESACVGLCLSGFTAILDQPRDRAATRIRQPGIAIATPLAGLMREPALGPPRLFLRS